jgi:hypothetical protein
MECCEIQKRKRIPDPLPSGQEASLYAAYSVMRSGS